MALRVWVVVVPEEDGSSYVSGVFYNKEDAEKVWGFAPEEFEVR